jgi:hypothetical protein
MPLMLYEQWLSKTDFDVNGVQPQLQWLWQHRMEFLDNDIDTQFFRPGRHPTASQHGTAMSALGPRIFIVPSQEHWPTGSPWL